MTQYAYLTPSGAIVSYSFDGAPPPLLRSNDHLDSGSPDEELVIAGPSQYASLLEGQSADLEILVAGIVAVLPRWVGARASVLATLGETLRQLSIGAPNLATESVRAALARVDAEVRNEAVATIGPDRASTAWIAHLVAVLAYLTA